MLLEREDSDIYLLFGRYLEDEPNCENQSLTPPFVIWNRSEEKQRLVYGIISSEIEIRVTQKHAQMT